MANNARGEVTIKIGKKKILLRPTFNAIANIESTLDMSIIQVYMMVAANTIRMSELASIIYYGGRAGDIKFDLDVDDIGQMLAEHGLLDLILPIGTFLGSIVSGHSKKKQNKTGKKIVQ